MSAYQNLLVFLCLACTTVEAATVVTAKERMTGTITAQNEKTVTLRGAAGEIKIPREQIVQIFDDNGELVWTSDSGIDANTPTQKNQIQGVPAFTQRNIIVDFGIGTAWGAFYKSENDILDGNIYVDYSDGTRQTAAMSMFTFAGGLNYQVYSTPRWSTLFSYFYRTTQQRATAGDGKKYKFENVIDTQISSLHAILMGKELHLYLGEGGSSFDFVGQIGYEAGSYYPLAGYNQARATLAGGAAAIQFSKPASVFLHGPTARIGSGVTFRLSEAWQFRIHGYYQIAYTFASEQIWSDTPKNVATHDVYLLMSLGYGF